jgi:hypothetical protein
MTELLWEQQGAQLHERHKPERPLKSRIQSFYHPRHGTKSREKFSRLKIFDAMLDAKSHSLKVRWQICGNFSRPSEFGASLVWRQRD